MKSWFLAVLLLLFFSGETVFAYQYRIQERSLDSAQTRVIAAISENLLTLGLAAINRQPEKLFEGLQVHQFFLSLTGSKRIGLVILDSPTGELPVQLDVSGGTVWHFPFRKSTLAIWTQGLSREEGEQLRKWTQRQIALETPTLWKQLIPQAYAERCPQSAWSKKISPLVETMGESKGSLCWNKFGEGIQAYASSVKAEAEKKLNFDLYEYWDQFKQTISGLVQFAGEFGSDPVGWIQKNVPSADSLDLSGLSEIDHDQVIGLACLSLGQEGASSLIAGLVRGPAGLGVKLYQLLNKISMVSKLLKLVKNLGQFSAEKLAALKGRLVALAEKLIKKEESPDKVESMAGLLRMSPAMAEEGFACMGL